MRCPACFRRLAPGASCPLHPEGGPAEEVRRLEAGTPPVVPGVTDLVLLGLGGSARVYRGRDAAGNKVAVKVALGRAAARLAREASALRRVGAPAVPAFVAEGQTEAGEPFVVMELLEGEPLSAWLAALPGAGAASIPDVVELAAALGDALDRVHAAGIVHRDVKPENLFLRRGAGPLRDRLALLDFGLARPAGEATWEGGDALELTRGGQRLGTAWYMAPEQGVEPRGVDFRADVYAAGCVLYELLCGAPPFRGDATAVVQAHVARRPPRPSEVAPVPPALDAPILRALAKDRAQRFASASALAAALAEAVRGGGPSASARRLVPILVTRLRIPITQIAQAVGPDGGHVVRVHGERQVVAFPDGSDVEVAARAALRAARRLVALGGEAPVFLHVAELQVRQTARGPAVAGPAVEKPAQWLPLGVRPGVVATPDAAPFVEGEPDLVVAGVPEADRTAARRATGGDTGPFVGHDALAAEIVRDVQAAAGDKRSLIIELSGPSGIGRSRLVAEIALVLAEELLVVPLQVPSPELEPPGGLAEKLGLRPGSVVVVDDVHHADETSLAALAGANLVAIVTRRGDVEWPSGTARREIAIPPLGPVDATRLAEALLGPSDGGPEAARRIAALSAGVPSRIVDLTRALWSTGAVRRLGKGRRQVTLDDALLVEGDPAGLPARIAARLLASLPGPLADLAGLCAVVGEVVTAEEIAGILDQPVSYPIAELDPGAALFRLSRMGILDPRAGAGFAFSSTSLADALAASLPAGVRRQHHDAALRFLLASGRTDEPALQRIWRHAAANEFAEEAHSAHLALAMTAKNAGRLQAAAYHLGAALDWLPADDPRREGLLRAITL